MEREKQLAAADYVEEWEDTKNRLQYSMDMAQATLKSLFLVNGASLVSLLTFIGNGGTVIEPRAIFWSFIWFSCGLSSVLTSFITAYFSQVYYMQSSMADAWKSKAKIYDASSDGIDGQRPYKIGERWEYTAIAFVVLSLAFFILGSFVALDALT